MTFSAYQWGGCVLEFSEKSLVSANPIVSKTLGNLCGPRDLEFDSSGNLWVANEYGGTVVEFNGASLGSGRPSVSAVISGLSQPALDQWPTSLAFDQSSNLWIGW